MLFKNVFFWENFKIIEFRILEKLQRHYREFPVPFTQFLLMLITKGINQN